MRRLLPLILLAACQPVTEPLLPEARGRAESAVVLAGGAMELHFTRPGTDDSNGEDPELDDALVALFDSAVSTLDVAIFELDHPGIVDGLVAAANRGVAVRMVGDGDEAEDSGYVAAAAAGVDIVNRPPRNRIMHNKFAVADGRWVWTGSANWTDNGVLRNNNHGLKIDSEDLADVYTEEFELMHGGLFGRSKDAFEHGGPVLLGDEAISVAFAPADAPHTVLLDAIDMAQERVFFMAFSFTRSDVSAALVAAQEAGIEVVGIFDESQAWGRYSKDEELALAGVPVFIDGNGNASGFSGGKLHHKVLIVDPLGAAPATVLGSTNWSLSASRDNDENLLLVEGPETAAALLDEFCGRLDEAALHPDYAGDRPDPCDGLLQPLRINEVFANPDGSDRDREWLEVVNTGNGPVDLQGWTISDELAVRHEFGAAVLQAQDAVVVGGDAPGAASPSSGSLSLNNNAETLLLSDPTGRVIDRVQYTSAVSGVSFNRAEDGTSAPGFVLHDTLGGDSSPGRRASGAVWGTTALINEAMPNPAGTDTDNEWVELVNPGVLPVDLGGWVLTDAASPQRHVFEPGVLLEPGQLLVIFSGGSHPDVPGHLVASSGQLGLNNTSDTLQLIDADGVVRDEVSWSSTSDGVSLNRAQDGIGGPFVEHTTLGAGPSSPGAYADGNDGSAASLVVNEALPDPAGSDSGQEYVEIVNAGDADVDLGGWSLGDAVRSDRHVFAAGTVVPAGGVVVVFDDGEHGAVPGAVNSSTGFLSLNNGGDLVRLFTPTGAVHSELAWTSSSEGVAWTRAVDADGTSLPVPHTDLGSDSSPGLRNDGSAW